MQGHVDDRTEAADTMNRIEGQLKGILDAVPKETYQDETTVSNAYQVPSLKTRVRSGDTWLNMQVAVHEDDVRGTNRVTIGLLESLRSNIDGGWFIEEMAIIF